MGQWVKGITLDLRQGFFVAWNEHHLNFYKFKLGAPQSENTKCSVQFECDQISSKEDFITDLLIYNEMHYFVISTNYGNISVYKWDHRQGTK